MDEAGVVHIWSSLARKSSRGGLPGLARAVEACEEVCDEVPGCRFVVVVTITGRAVAESRVDERRLRVPTSLTLELRLTGSLVTAYVRMLVWGGGGIAVVW